MLEFIRNLFKKMFYVSDTINMSKASTLVFFTSIIPLQNFKLIIFALLILFYNSNIFALFIGLSLGILFPTILTFIRFVIQNLISLNFINSLNMFLSSLAVLKNPIVKISIFTILALLLCLFILGIYIALYKLLIYLYNKLAVKNLKKNFFITLQVVLVYIGSVSIFSLTVTILSLKEYIFEEKYLDLFSRALNIVQFNILDYFKSGKFEIIYAIFYASIIAISIYPLFLILYSFNIKAIRAKSDEKNFVFLDLTGSRWKQIVKYCTFIIIFTILQFLILLVSNYSNVQAFDANKYTTYDKVEETAYTIDTKTQPIYTFYYRNDPKSQYSLEKYFDKISVVIPDLFEISSDFSLKDYYCEKLEQILKEKENKTKVIPSLSIYQEKKYDYSFINSFINNTDKQNIIIEKIKNKILLSGYNGICIDLGYIDIKDIQKFNSFIKKIKSEFEKNNLELYVSYSHAALSINPALVNLCDKIILSIEFYSVDKPSPIINFQALNSKLNSLLSIPSNKIILCAYCGGYDWNISLSNSTEKPRFLSYEDVLINAVNYKNSKIIWDNSIRNPYYEYTDKNMQNHKVWFVDATSIYNTYKISKSKNYAGFAIYGLGYEDENMWNILENNDPESIKHSLNTIKIHSVIFNGNGEIIKDISIQQYGKREIKFDSYNYISQVEYIELPQFSTVTFADTNNDKQIALTFDDGPDPKYTPQILDILKTHGVPATFFVVGQNAEKYKDILERTYSDGHDIGNHTYSHLNFTSNNSKNINDLEAELDKTQNIIQLVTGRKTKLFREPNIVSIKNFEYNTLKKYINVLSKGYYITLSSIDPNDWADNAPYTMLNKILEELNEHKGNVILFHDAVETSENTIDLLPILIKYLKQNNYEFVKLDKILNVSHDDIMPVVNTTKDVYLYSLKNSKNFLKTILDNLDYILSTLLLLSTLICLLRIILLIIFSIKQKIKYKHQDSKFDNNYKPSVSVIIAAYNEEKVICKTIHSILKSNYPNFDIIIVNDGSTDNTKEVIENEFFNNPKVKLINKSNGGKSTAINWGYLQSNSEIVVALDADTIIEPNAISLMVRHFEDKEVAAVAGNIKVGNLNNPLTIFQHIEYVTGINLERRSFDALGCITIVPGAIGAWRRDVVLKYKGLQHDTLAEDADLTIEIVKKGHKIKYEEKAKAFTEAPDKLMPLLKQRSRWAYGILQCIWKHKEVFFNPKYKTLGLFAFPSTILFSFVFQIASVFLDVFMTILLFTSFNLLAYKLIGFYILFLILDFLLVVYAFKMENENYKPLKWFIIYRIVYRLILSYVILKSCISALKGVRVNWNKLIRTGNVKVNFNIHKYSEQ